MVKKIFNATLSFILIVLMGVSTASCGQKTVSEETPAKYVFLFIGDGMGAGHTAVTESYLSYKAGKLGGEQLCFTGFPYLGTCTTYSADHHVTCSSAAGTAISCGAKTNNRCLGVDPEGNPLRSITYDLKDLGYNIGVMSSVPVNHATPASFYAHNQSRHDYYSITMEIPQSGFNFFAGSGFLQYAGQDNEQVPAPAALEEKGYAVCFSEEEFRARMDSTEHIIFIQPSGKKAEADNYEVEGVKENDSRLAEVLQMGLDFLGEEKPFFIMCEGGEIDWAAHDNHTMEMIEAVLRFNEAVETAYKFYTQHPDETLIVVTADHETGGITLGSDGKLTINWEAAESAYKASGNPATENENKALNKEVGIGWTSSNHTGAPVPIYAIGKGAERFAGRMDNTDIKGKILNN